MAPKKQRSISDLVAEKATLEAKLAALEVEEKARGEEIEKQKEEVMARCLVKYFTQTSKKDELAKILDQTLTKKADRQIFGLAPKERKTPEEKK